MKIIAGLGNPGRKYDGTRHNVGFDTITVLAERHSDGRGRQKFEGETFDANIGGEKVLLLRPLTYMNRSGGSVLAARDFYKLQNEDILVVCDDFNLPLGKLRLRAAGSSGGQKGLADIIRRLGGENIPRLRIGIDPPPGGWDVADYVLSKFQGDDAKEMEQNIARAANAAADWVTVGIEAAMNQYN